MMNAVLKRKVFCRCIPLNQYSIFLQSVEQRKTGDRRIGVINAFLEEVLKTASHARNGRLVEEVYVVFNLQDEFRPNLGHSECQIELGRCLLNLYGRYFKAMQIPFLRRQTLKSEHDLKERIVAE